MRKTRVSCSFFDPLKAASLTSVYLAELFGSCTIYLSGSAADFLRGRFIVANWDVDELVKYKDAIINDGLLKNQPFKGDIGNGGHFARASDHA